METESAVGFVAVAVVVVTTTAATAIPSSIALFVVRIIASSLFGVVFTFGAIASPQVTRDGNQGRQWHDLI